MTFCPVCETDSCELDELRAELAHVPLVLVDADQLAAYRERVRSAIDRVALAHGLVNVRGVGQA